MSGTVLYSCECDGPKSCLHDAYVLVGETDHKYNKNVNYMVD